MLFQFSYGPEKMFVLILRIRIYLKNIFLLSEGPSLP